MYAPYYRQAAMKVYSMSPEEREPIIFMITSSSSGTLKRMSMTG